jgi:hypothetical protein
MVKQFSIDKNYRKQTKLSLFTFVCFVFSGIFVWYNDYFDAQLNEEPVGYIGPICCLLFGVMSIAAYLTLRQLPRSSVSVDEEGLWLRHLERKCSIVNFDSIEKIKEHDVRGFIQLYDNQGKKLLRIETQLHQFADLRNILHQRTGKIDAVPVSPEINKSKANKKDSPFTFIVFIVFTLMFGGGLIVFYIIDPEGGIPHRESLTKIEGQLISLTKDGATKFKLSTNNKEFQYISKSGGEVLVAKKLTKAGDSKVTILVRMENVEPHFITGKMHYTVFEISIDDEPVRTYEQISAA